MGRFPRPASPWARMGSCPRCSGHRERYLPSEWHHFPVTLGTLASLDALNIKSNDIHDVKMRTTLTLDDDLAGLLGQRARAWHSLQGSGESYDSSGTRRNGQDPLGQSSPDEAAFVRLEGGH